MPLLQKMHPRPRTIRSIECVYLQLILAVLAIRLKTHLKRTHQINVAQDAFLPSHWNAALGAGQPTDTSPERIQSLCSEWPMTLLYMFLHLCLELGGALYLLKTLQKKGPRPCRNALLQQFNVHVPPSQQLTALSKNFRCFRAGLEPPIAMSHLNPPPPLSPSYMSERLSY
ncbi:hypothetical protein CPB85DRAFT_894733 [Mucidula mucida]|nr:hypothetical protein CPB85DRAFT_894733 [Mucidula mucida]